MSRAARRENRTSGLVSLPVRVASPILAALLLCSAVAVPERGPQKTVSRWMKSMSLRDKVAQLVMIPFSGRSISTKTRDYRKFVHLIRDVHVGGLILVNVAQGRLAARPEPHELASFVNRLQRMSKLPLLVGGDFERGASMRVSGTTVFPHAMAFAAAGDPALTRYEGEVTAREARAVGVHWIFYPDADVNNNPDNPIINIRSFGENPQVVSRHVQAFIEGAGADRRSRVLTTAKHFPGHGDTATDTHLGLAVINADRQRLNDVELAPFRAAISKDVDAVMTAHISVPALDSADVLDAFRRGAHQTATRRTGVPRADRDRCDGYGRHRQGFRRCGSLGARDRGGRRCDPDATRCRHGGERAGRCGTPRPDFAETTRSKRGPCAGG